MPPLPANVVELRTGIIAAVAEVTPDRLRSVWQETDYRLDAWSIINGSHIESQLAEVKHDVLSNSMTVPNTVHVF
jgi:hypothetical protein